MAARVTNMIGESDRYRAAWYNISLGLPDTATTTTTIVTTTHSDEVTRCSNSNKLTQAATGIPYKNGSNNTSSNNKLVRYEQQHRMNRIEPNIN